MEASVQTPLRRVFIDCVWPVGGDAAVLGAGMAAFEDIKPGSGVDPAGIAEIAKLKHMLRKAAARTVETICTAIGEILAAFTSDECANYFRNSGYALT